MISFDKAHRNNYIFMDIDGKVLLEKFIVLNPDTGHVDYKKSWFRPSLGGKTYHRMDAKDEPRVPHDMIVEAVQHFKAQVKFIQWKDR